MANQVYNSFKKSSMVGEINLSADTIKVILVTSGYTPDIDNHTAYSNITNEVVGAGYTTSGITLSAVTVTTDLANDRAVLDAADVTWVSSTITAAAAVIFKLGATPATSPLIGYVDFGGSKSSSNGDFVIQWNTNGILTLT